MSVNFSSLKKKVVGEVFDDALTKNLYATDASVYREIPLGVVVPKTTEDIKEVIAFCKKNNLFIIPRATGTSLAGQCVGEGVVVDITKHFNNLLELNVKEKWARVGPGIIRDELNTKLKEHKLFFSPITSTSNRATIGGMVGNNSSGANSIVYGSTRENVLEIKAILSNNEEVTFKELSKKEFKQKLTLKSLEGEIYRQIHKELQDNEIRRKIAANYPKPSIHRRNMGYCLDILLKSNVFNAKGKGENFNFSKLLCGSEGTLAFITEIKLKLNPLPDKYHCLVAFHFDDLGKSMRATQEIMKFKPFACELMDEIILECTKTNIAQRKNRYFVVGDPRAILIVEIRSKKQKELQEKTQLIIDKISEKLSYASPIIHPPNTEKAWQLRNAGLGVLANIPGEKKAIACIEDTAVAVSDLANYIKEFDAIMKRFKQKPVYYAHAGAGELHLRPKLDLKKEEGIKDFFAITKRVATLVKKYRGSLSGEHGDGRVRSPYIPYMLGKEIYNCFARIKKVWDEDQVFNRGKIVASPAKDTSFRYLKSSQPKEVSSFLDFSKEGGILTLAEKCHGAGDCRKLPSSGGTMCPSYQATRDEKDTTRARANALREFLGSNGKKNPYNHKELHEVLDLCLSCKGCTSECPANVDMATLKAEFQYQYYKSNPVPLRNYFFVYLTLLNNVARQVPGLKHFVNFTLKNSLTSLLIKKALRVAPERVLPRLGKRSLREWYKKNYPSLQKKSNLTKKVFLFNDEFTNHYDSEIGSKAILLLSRLGYEVVLLKNQESGRAAISKGFLKYAKEIAEKNLLLYQGKVNENTPLIGLEPSAILTFRDEYPKLFKNPGMKKLADDIKKNTFLLEEFLLLEMERGNLKQDAFHSKKRTIAVHGHCHQKSLSDINIAKKVLSLPKNHEVKVIPSGCCGMAGSFGYEKEHYAISQKIANLVLLPNLKEILQKDPHTFIVANGVSCREQLNGKINKKIHHFVELLE